MHMKKGYPAVNTANIVTDSRLTGLSNHIFRSICTNNNALFFLAKVKDMHENLSTSKNVQYS